VRHFRLIRMVEQPGVWTLGRIEDEERRQVCVVAERGWVDKNGDGLGDRNESRIPAGTYECTRDMHGKSKPATAYEVWEINGVPGRSEVHIHIGNNPQVDSLGCPLVGLAFGANGTVSGSRLAFEKWMKLTAGEQKIRLTVVDIEPAQAAA
jgi:hypothetical protein